MILACKPKNRLHAYTRRGKKITTIIFTRRNLKKPRYKSKQRTGHKQRCQHNNQVNNQTKEQMQLHSSQEEKEYSKEEETLYGHSTIQRKKKYSSGQAFVR